jgi:pyridoxine/pyridoxamine 5'-phosphate oxidase
MAIKPQIFIVLRDGKPNKIFRRIRKRMVDAVIAASEPDAMRLAMERNPLRPNERFVLLAVAETSASMDFVRGIRARRDAEIDEMRELVGT